MIIFWIQRAWNYLKIRGMVLWWTIKYRGKKNIPPELIFEQMTESMAGLKDNLMQAFRLLDEDTTEEERKQFMSLISNVNNLEHGLNDVKKDNFSN